MMNTFPNAPWFVKLIHGTGSWSRIGTDRIDLMATIANLRTFVLAVGLLLPLLALAEAQSEARAARVALVMGNGDYRAQDPLAGVADDVAAVGRALEHIGFSVTVASDLNNGAFRAALNTFSDQIESGDLALFYFMGYAVQVKGRNFLLPVGVELRREFDLLTRGVAMDAILHLMESAGAETSVVMLDASYPDRVSASHTWATPGLAEPSGSALKSLVVYSAQPNAEIPPPDSQGSLFARALSAALQRPGPELVAVLQSVEQDVEQASNGRQRPWIDPDFYGAINIGEAGAPATAALPPAQGEASGPPTQAPPPETASTGEPAGSPEVATLPPAGQEPPSAAVPQAPEPVDMEALGKAYEGGLTPDARGDIQRDLRELGFYRGGIDKDFGPGTRAGISRFQRNNGDQPTGYITEDQTLTLSALATERRQAAEAERQAEAARQQAEREEAERRAAAQRAAEEAERRAAEQAAQQQKQQQATATGRLSEIERLTRLAEDGDAKAQAALGVRYFHGRGVKKDHAKAVYWYRKAAEQNEASAQTNLGFLYFNGFGVEKDLVQAAQWLRRAAEQGQREAQFNLGMLYENGSGVSQSYKEAAKWYGKAADQGVTEAANRLKLLRSRNLIQ
jgi:peptidoglycan hydrolase-like protein with peptidoglycan-binding domain